MATRHLRGKTGKNRHSSFFTVFPGPVALIFSTARAVKTGTQKKVIYIYIFLCSRVGRLYVFTTRAVKTVNIVLFFCYVQGRSPVCFVMLCFLFVFYNKKYKCSANVQI